METKLKMTNALSAASIGGSVNQLPYQIPNTYSFLPQNHYNNPAVIPNIPNTIPSVPNLSGLQLPGSLCNTLNNSNPGMNAQSINKLSSSGQSSFKSIAHHSSPAVDYRQPSPPGVTKDRHTKDSDLTMEPPSSRKRLYNDGNKQLGYVGIQSIDPIKEIESDSSIPTTKESPLAKRRHGDFITTNAQAIGRSSNNEAQVIPNLVSPTPSPGDTATLYSKAWAQQMKLLQQNQATAMSNTALQLNSNLASNYTSLSALDRSFLNGLPQSGSFDADAYNATLLLNQSLANASTNPYLNTQASGYTSTQPAAAFPTQYGIYNPNSFWF